ncbi:hypothetical protein [Geoalkalibacter halelectricus]|uniref:hypothetical protein n=1 Tax=Geoalkalibacter halelectricus TaxID=2847045 RepID=UPI003D20F199
MEEENGVFAGKKKRKKSELIHQKQLELFLIPEAPGSGLSHTIEFLSSAPRFVRGKNLTQPRDYEGKLNIVRSYEDKINKVLYGATVTISPAIMELVDKKNGVVEECFVYPGSDVEILEKIFIKLGTRGQGKLTKDSRGRSIFGVSFTINQIVNEMRALGKARRPAEIIQAIETGVNTRVTIKVESPDKKDCWEISDGIFSNFIRVRRSQYEQQDELDKACFIALHPLVVKCLQDQGFRKFDYEKNLSYSSPLTRWIHERLSHKYIYAATGHGYNFRLTTFVKLFGGSIYVSLKDNHKEFKKSLDDLLADGVLKKWDYEIIKDKNDKRKTIDYKYFCWASDQFIASTIQYNIEKSERSRKYLNFIEKIDSDWEEST